MEQKKLTRDFYDVRKVDTHVHHSALMHVKDLLDFITDKYHVHNLNMINL